MPIVHRIQIFRTYTLSEFPRTHDVIAARETPLIKKKT